MTLAQVSAAIALALSALPPPPEKAVFETSMYGTVTLDHRAHLALRISCKRCHGDGPVRKIDFTPKEAHDRCRGCHIEGERGPTACRGCHVVPVAPATVEAAADTGSGPEVVVAAAQVATPPDGTPGAATIDPEGAARAGPAAIETVDDLRRRATRRTVEVGMTGVHGSREGLMSGPAVRLVMQEGRLIVVHSIEGPGMFEGGGRTVALVGGGVRLPLPASCRFSAVALGGIDVIDRTSTLVPAVGLRVGVEWAPGGLIQALGVTVTGVSDVLRYRNSLGEQIGDDTLSTGVHIGFRMPPGSR